MIAAAAERLRRLNSTTNGPDGSAERSSDTPGERKESHNLTNASDAVREASLRGSPDKRKRSEAPTESAGDAVSESPAAEQELDMHPPVAKRTKLSNVTTEGVSGSVERRSSIAGEREESQNLTNPADTARETSRRASFDKIKRPDLPASSAADVEALRAKWAQKLMDIQSREPNQGSGSFNAGGLRELTQVLTLTHPNSTEDEEDERKELLKAMQRRISSPNPGSLGWADLSSVRLICLIPQCPDRSLREELENEACRVDLEGSSRGRRPFPVTAVRRLRRVFKRADPDYQQSSLYHEVKTALEGKDAIGKSLLKSCLDHLFPSAEDVKGDKASNSAKKPSALNREVRPAKVVTPQKQVAASKGNLVVVPTITRSQTSSPTLERRSASSTASLTPRPTRSTQMNVEDSDGLLRTFIAVNCSILPIFDLPGLKLLYRAVRTRGDDVPASKLAIINLCFALASRSHDQGNTQRATDFYHRGSSSLPSVKESGDILRLIQGHILQAQYLLGIGDLDEASVAISSAISRAHSEGMHTKAGAYHPIPEQDLQLRVKIWHAVQVLERTLALYRGVAPPNFCSDCNAAFPRAPAVSTEDQLVTQTQRVGFVAFNAWARLYQPVDRLMDIEREFRIYELGCPMHKIACDFKDYNEEHARLSEWKRSLSERLKDVPNDNDGVSRLRRIINLRYLYYRLRLHRPFLILAISLSLDCSECPGNKPHLPDRSLEAPIELAVIRDGFFKCLGAAAQLFKNLDEYTRQYTTTQSFHKDCLTEYAEFAYACGLVFIAALMVPDLAMSPDSRIKTIGGLRAARISAAALLRKYEKVDRRNTTLGMRISRCADALDALSKALGVEEPFGFISEGVGLPLKSWQKLYGRLKVDIPVRQSIPSTADSSMSFGWIESQVVDFDD